MGPQGAQVIRNEVAAARIQKNLDKKYYIFY